jgi:hypothetical protein
MRPTWRLPVYVPRPPSRSRPYGSSTVRHSSSSWWFRRTSSPDVGGAEVEVASTQLQIAGRCVLVPLYAYPYELRPNSARSRMLATTARDASTSLQRRSPASRAGPSPCADIEAHAPTSNTSQEARRTAEQPVTAAIGYSVQPAMDSGPTFVDDASRHGTHRDSKHKGPMLGERDRLTSASTRPTALLPAHRAKGHAKTTPSPRAPRGAERTTSASPTTRARGAQRSTRGWTWCPRALTACTQPATKLGAYPVRQPQAGLRVRRPGRVADQRRRGRVRYRAELVAWLLVRDSKLYPPRRPTVDWPRYVRGRAPPAWCPSNANPPTLRPLDAIMSRVHRRTIRSLAMLARGLLEWPCLVVRWRAFDARRTVGQCLPGDAESTGATDSSTTGYVARRRSNHSTVTPA